MRRQVAEPKRRFAKVLRRKSTIAETALWKLLRARRLAHMKFRRQVPIDNWIVDFICFEQRLVVEADGSQHAESFRDRVRDAHLKSQDFHILRFWNNDILARPEQVMNAIIAHELTPSPGALRAPPSPARGEGRNPASVSKGLTHV